MYRLRLEHQPEAVPTDVVFRIAPDAAMGAKELAVQQTVADLGFATPRVRLTRPPDQELGGAWSVMDFATGTPPLGDLNGIGALRRAPTLFNRLPAQLAGPMAALHALDPEPVSAAVDAMAPTVVWRVDRLLEHFEVAASALDRPDLATAIRALIHRRPPEGVTVICHGDLHPFNLLVTDDGAVTVIDWTAAVTVSRSPAPWCPGYCQAFSARCSKCSKAVTSPPRTSAVVSNSASALGSLILSTSSRAWSAVCCSMTFSLIV